MSTSNQSSSKSYGTLKSQLWKSVRDLIYQIGDDPDRPGLKETPERVLKAWEFWSSGYKQDPNDILKLFEDGSENYDEMVFQGSIPVYSNCEHHMTPFFGVAHVGYLPKDQIVGLSKIARIVDVFARRLQVQERLTRQIAECLYHGIKANGVGVVLRCRHLCLESRGVQKQGTITYTSSLMGSIKHHEGARSEFLQFVRQADDGQRI